MTIRYLTSGESHGPALTAILEGIPAGLPLDAETINADLARRQQGFGAGGRMDIEKDRVRILGGVMNGQTTGAPIALMIENKDHANWIGKAVPAYVTPRPGHADLAACVKYGYDDIRPSLERASARETAARVAVGSICRALLSQFGITIHGKVLRVGDGSAAPEELIAQIRRQGETLGGIIEVIADNLPIGLGSHVNWDRRLDSRLGAAFLGIPAIKGIEIGDAFENTTRPGTQVHDGITPTGRTSNRAGGVEGGITNGQPLVVRLAMKPIPTTIRPQQTINAVTKEPSPTTYERSDFCPVPRAVVVMETTMAYVLANALCEKLGGDSIAEMKPRFDALPNQQNGLKITPSPKVFWP